jgi:hypothetical protein
MQFDWSNECLELFKLFIVVVGVSTSVGPWTDE